MLHRYTYILCFAVCVLRFVFCGLCSAFCILHSAFCSPSSDSCHHNHQPPVVISTARRNARRRLFKEWVEQQQAKHHHSTILPASGKGGWKLKEKLIWSRADLAFICCGHFDLIASKAVSPDILGVLLMHDTPTLR